MSVADPIEILHAEAAGNEPLLSVLNRASALRPLLVPLAVLPGLFCLENWAIDEGAGSWGLRSLHVLQADHVWEVIDPDRPASLPAFSDVTGASKWQPPLACWLTALTMKVFQSDSLAGLWLVPFLSTAGLIVMSFVLAEQHAGRRVAFWAALMVAFCGPVIRLYGNVGPVSLSVLLALVAFWGFLHHCQQSTRPASFKLLAGGAALGLCVLAGGPFALLVLAVLLFYVLGLQGDAELVPGKVRTAAPPLNDGTASRKSPHPRRTKIWTGWLGLYSLLGLTLTAFSIGGWWVLMMESQYGAEFWNAWWTGVAPDQTAIRRGAHTEPALAVDLFGELAVQWGPLSGLVVLGIWRAARARTTDNAVQDSFGLLMVVWLAVGVLAYAAIVGHGQSSPHLVDACRTFFVLPGLLLAARSADDICQRRIGLVGTVCAAGVSLVLLTLIRGTEAASGFRVDVMLWCLAGAVVTAGLAEVVVAQFRRSRFRTLLVMLVTGLLVSHAAAGLASARTTNPDNQALTDFQDRLSARADRDVEAWTLVADSPVPARLVFAIRSLWPDADVYRAESWEVALARRATSAAGVQAVIVWKNRHTPPADHNLLGLRIEQTITPAFFARRELHSYLVRSE